MLTLEEQLRRFHMHSLTLGWRSFLKYSSKNLVVFSPCPNNVSRPELRGNKLICLVEDISPPERG